MTTTKAMTNELDVVFEVSDRDALNELMAAIDRNDIAARTVDISRNGDVESVEVDLSILTPTQRRTLELAVESGYYQQPRKTDLGSLGDRLDISKSAASQRLRGAERKLVTTVFR